jgi:putative holliday junction resolvase
MNPINIIALDVGTKRIGVAHADTGVKLPVAYTTIDVDGMEFARIREIIAEFEPQVIVIGFPRNQQGETTAQTDYVIEFARKLDQYGIEVVYQDESLTSVLAEDYLKSLQKPYAKADIDAHAAAIILGDYIEERYGV